MKNHLALLLLLMPLAGFSQVVDPLNVLGEYDPNQWKDIELYESETHVIAVHRKTDMYNSWDDWTTTWADVFYINKDTRRVDGAFEKLRRYKYEGEDCNYIDQQLIDGKLVCFYTVLDSEEKNCQLIARTLNPDGTEEDPVLLLSREYAPDVPRQAHFDVYSNKGVTLIRKTDNNEAIEFRGHQGKYALSPDDLQEFWVVNSSDSSTWPLVKIADFNSAFTHPEVVQYTDESFLSIGFGSKDPPEIDRYSTTKNNMLGIYLADLKGDSSNSVSLIIETGHLMVPIMKKELFYEMRNDVIYVYHMAMKNGLTGMQCYAIDVNTLTERFTTFIPLPSEFSKGDTLVFTSVISDDPLFNLMQAGNGTYNFNLTNVCVNEDGSCYAVFNNAKQEIDYTASYYDMLVMRISASGELEWYKILPRDHDKSSTLHSNTPAMASQGDFHFFFLDEEENTEYWLNGGPDSGIELEELDDEDDGVLFHMTFHPDGRSNAHVIPLPEEEDDLVPHFRTWINALDHSGIYTLYYHRGDAYLVKIEP